MPNVAQLRAAGELTDAELSAMESAVAAELDMAIAEADAAPVEAAEDLTKFVYAERS